MKRYGKTNATSIKGEYVNSSFHTCNGSKMLIFVDEDGSNWNKVPLKRRKLRRNPLMDVTTAAQGDDHLFKVEDNWAGAARAENTSGRAFARFDRFMI